MLIQIRNISKLNPYRLFIKNNPSQFFLSVVFVSLTTFLANQKFCTFCPFRTYKNSSNLLSSIIPSATYPFPSINLLVFIST